MAEDLVRELGTEGKQIVFEIYQRNGKIIVFPVSSRSEDALLSLIRRYTKKGNIYYTDERHAYVSLVFRGKHIRITKEKGNLSMNKILMAWKVSSPRLNTGSIIIEECRENTSITILKKLNFGLTIVKKIYLIKLFSFS